MKRKTQIQFLLLVVGLAIIILFSFYLIRQNKTNTSPPLLNANVNLSQAENSSLPIRLKIPAINIDAEVEDVGLTKDGAMDVPSGPDTVAWFDLGPRPGDIGDSVIDGHSGYKNNRPAVFDNLHKLKIGDKIYVEDAKGETTTFVVRNFHSYDQNETVPQVFVSSDGLAHLNLITCSGYWNVSAQTHSDRLVVFTDEI